MSDRLWQAKLAAWTHDPAEKALVLLRDPAGHEGGTVLKLRNKIFNSGKIPAGLGTLVKKADHWAAAADRPQFPQDPEKRFVGWAQVNFAHQPELIHPLSGTRFVKREVFRDIQPEHIKAVSLDHFDGLIQTSNGETDWRNTSLAFWRFGPETPSGEIGALWGLLPADTRIPDHTIWSHLDLSSAFATVFLADPQQMPALLAVSFGPVQGFIAQARSTSDLWAGSHLLSCIAWEGLKVICEELGPDCVLFPQLRGVPLVDLWLHQDCGMPLELFEDAKCEWLEGATDNNSLFSAALPNRFVALIPAARAGELGEKITKSVREWVKSEARAMLEMVLDAANQPVDPNAYCFEQLKRQLSEFPEVHWASVPWMCGRNEKASDGETRLLKTLHKFYPPGDGGKGKDRTETKPSYFGTTAWGLLSSAIDVQGARFFDPNPGVLYPAVYDMLERVAAAAKAVRPFTQLEQSGYRDTLTGEAEWLALDRAHLDLRPGQRKATLWARVSENKPAWARKGEHLSTLGMMKRVWPNRFVDLLKKNQFDGLDIRRYVVSTHTMALATSLDRFLEQEEKTQDQKDAIKEIEKEIEGLDAAVLPRDMMKNLRSADDMTRRFVRLVPTLLDKKRDNEASARGAGEEAEARRKRKDVETLIKKALSPDQSKPEAYYAFILMDGDRMGAWLAGNENEYQLAYGDIWHSSVKNAVDRFEDKSLKQYLIEKRHASPARHAAISESLNAFSLNLARHVVEDLFKGKLLYAGGDDVMAMVSVDDLLPAMLLLRLVYSGIATEREVDELPAP
ncbi:MAG: type III-B CRISPR-associated protein Cas10/Cmr2 [Pseudomonadota bacterium]